MWDIGFEERIMLSKSQIKYIQSLHRKKYRDRYALYIVDGDKMVKEYLNHVPVIHSIYATAPWIDKNRSALDTHPIECHTISEEELKKISTLKTCNQALALVKVPAGEKFDLQAQKTGLYLVLDQIQDPGNLGTIIRTADWFGLERIFCSTDCVEAYNPKVVQSTMGSLTRVKVHYVDLPELLDGVTLPLFAATLSGKNIFTENLPKDAVILIGNESKGISPSLLKLATEAISIPKFGKAESLNAAIATGIVLSRFVGGK